MPRPARRYDIFLRLARNDGRLIPDAYFKEVERRLRRRFGGVTAQRREFPMRGIWEGTGQIFLDDVVMLITLDFRRNGSERFIRSLKSQLLRQFDQLEILITEVKLRVH
jgi:hypothetical protein